MSNKRELVSKGCFLVYDEDFNILLFFKYIKYLLKFFYLII